MKNVDYALTYFFFIGYIYIYGYTAVHYKRPNYDIWLFSISMSYCEYFFTSFPFGFWHMHKQRDTLQVQYSKQYSKSYSTVKPEIFVCVTNMWSVFSYTAIIYLK